jgi:hypothetical protein
MGNSTIQIWSQYSIPLGSYINLQYNSIINGKDTPPTAISYASINGIKVLGASYSIQSNIINITNLFQTPFNSTNNESNIEFTIPVFINPPTTKPTPYVVTIYSNNGYPIAQYTYMYIAAMQSFMDAEITSSSYTVMDSMVSYSLKFVTNFNFKSISIIIPP